MAMSGNASRWRQRGVRIIRAAELDDNTPQTPGMFRRAAEYLAEAGPGDFIYVPPYVPHQEINASDELELHCVLARSGQQGLVVNLDITPVEVPELVRWIDDLHK